MGDELHDQLMDDEMMRAHDAYYAKMAPRASSIEPLPVVEAPKSIFLIINGQSVEYRKV